jgi:hypothetical protein
LQDAVQAVLGEKGLRHGGAAFGDPAYSPGIACAHGQCTLGVNGLMGTMEGAQAEVDYTHRQVARVRARAPLLGDMAQVGKAKSQRVYRSRMGVLMGGPTEVRDTRGGQSCRPLPPFGLLTVLGHDRPLSFSERSRFREPR